MSSPARENTVLSGSVGAAEGLKPVNILCILIEAEVEKKFNLLRGREVH